MHAMGGAGWIETLPAHEPGRFKMYYKQPTPAVMPAEAPGEIA